MSDLDLTKGMVQDYIESQKKEETSQVEQPQESPDTEESSLHTESATVEQEQTEQVENTATVEESSIEQEQTTEAESESATEQTEEQESTQEETLSPEEFIDYIYSETEGDEELREALLNKFGVKKDPFANEQVAQLNKFIQDTGRSVEDYYRIQSLNTENMSAKDAVLQAMSLENPDMTTDELNLLFEDTYKLDEDEYSEKEVQISQAKLKRDGKKALSTLNQLKSEWQKPLTKQEAALQQEYLPSDFGDVFKSEVSDIDSFEFALNDKGESFEFKIDDKYASSVQGINPQDPLGRYRGKDGKIDAYRMAEEQALVDNIDSIIKSVYQQGLSKGRKSTVVDKKNLNITQENRPPEQAKPTKQQEQTRQALDRIL